MDRKIITFLPIAILCMLSLPSGAQNPIIQTKYTADPAPMVYNDTIFLYTTHDEDDADGFLMKDWLLYTSTDMVNWTDHGAVASLEDFKWRSRDNGAWAEQVIERDGKFYMYCPLHGHGIGVLVSDTPYGPFVDPLGKPLVWQQEHWCDIDPTVYIDDDGQAYMYWGNPNLYYVRLNRDMISYSGDIVKLDTPDKYQEGPWFYRRGDKYYLAFASTCCPEGMGYAMSDSPTGPWTTRGYIMAPTSRSNGNHPGIIDYKGKTYVFGLNYELLRRITDKHHERRSVSAAEMKYNSDGTIRELPFWSECYVEQIEPFNPFRRVEAETMAWGWGLKTAPLSGHNQFLTDIDNGEYLLLKGVDFGKKGAKQITVNGAAVKNGGRVSVRIDAADGPVIGVVNIETTGASDAYRDFTARLKRVKGIHDLYLCFEGDGADLFNIDWWMMK